MQNSRAIETQHILEYPVEDRFLKLPVEGFLKVQDIVPIEPQCAMINYVNGPDYRFIVACLSRRTGKTFIANTLAFLKAMEPGTKVLVVSPNFSLTNISWNEQVKVLKEHEIEVESKSKTSREIWLLNGSMIKFGSLQNPDSLVGHSYDLILVDEAALENKGGDVFNVQLRPTLDKPNSKIIFISTPRGNNYFKEFYDRGFSDDPRFAKWASIHSTWRDNPRANPSDIEDAKASMSKAEFQQEYEANFTTFEGQIYEAFDIDKHIIDELPEFPSWRFDTVMGIDPGYKDATGGVVIKYDTESELYYCVWDYEEAGKLTSTHAAAFGDAYSRFDVDMIFCDSAAAQFRQDMAVEYDLPSAKAKKSILDGIAFVQTLIENDRLLVHRDCEHMINMLLNYRWDPNPALIKPKPVHDRFSHLADAVRYALYSYRC